MRIQGAVVIVGHGYDLRSGTIDSIPQSVKVYRQPPDFTSPRRR
jgi:hypothetical protein